MQAMKAFLPGGVSLGLCAAAIVMLHLLACQRRDQRQTTPRPGGPAAGALIIAYSPDSADTFACAGRDSAIVLDLLASVAQTRGIAIATKTYPFGILVEQIGYRRNGEGGYWLYTVNGAMIPESAGRHRAAAGDTIRFFFHGR